MKVVYCGELDRTPDAPDHLGIKQGMEDIGWDWHIVDPLLGDPTPDQVAGQINQLRPDLVLHGNSDSLSVHLCGKISLDIRQVFWMLDYRTPQMLPAGTWDQWRRSAPYLDCILISAKNLAPLWQKAFGVDVFFAPHACWIPPRLTYSKEHDLPLLFIGGMNQAPPYNARTRLIGEIQAALKDVTQLVVVNASSVEGRNKVWRQMPLYYYSSQVVLDISHFWDDPGYCSGRSWYTATLGACAVAKRYPECERFFPHRHKWYFDTPQQAAELIKGLLLDPGERQDTRERVCRYAWGNHSYKIRFEQVLQILEKREDVIL